jgi:hypothetical protein
MEIDGVNYNLIMTLAAEVGFELAIAFPSPKNFTSWMGLCPNKRITGGKILSSKSNKKKNRLAQAFRQAANTIGRQKNTPMADFFRRIAFAKGRKVAITATARKLAVIVYIMLVNKQKYQPQGLEDYREKVRTKKVKYIQRTIQQLEIKVDEIAFH